MLITSRKNLNCHLSVEIFFRYFAENHSEERSVDVFCVAQECKRYAVMVRGA